MKLPNIYRTKGSILKDEGETLGREVIMNLAQNLADYIALIDKKINYGKLITKLG